MSHYILLLAIILLTFSTTLPAQETAKFFKQNCSSCHWIGGGRLIGPDLKNVLQRKDRAWLTRFMMDPPGMIKSGDPYVLKLQAEANGVIMPPVPNITIEIVDRLLDFIEAETKLDSSRFMGTPVAAEPFSEADAALGIELFTGRTGLVKSGPSCVSCHTVNSVGSRLGGRLGPDLTDVFTRLQGRNALTAWLSAPPTPTMQSAFLEHHLEPDEVKYLVSYFESVKDKTGYNFDSLLIWMSVIFCGLGGSVFGLVLFSELWGDRFRAVRRPLIRKSKK